ncbi:MAG: hypothetical protein ACKVOI_03550 [Dongiaceae bacterium]
MVERCGWLEAPEERLTGHGKCLAWAKTAGIIGDRQRSQLQMLTALLAITGSRARPSPLQ